VGTDGIITTVVGSGPVWPDEGQTGGNGDPANLGRIKRPEDVKIGADGRIIIGEFTGHNVRAVTAALPGFNDSDILLPSVDGSQLFRFDIVGKHLQTFNSLTGAVMYEFFYTPDGSLDHFEDGDGKTTQVQRNGSGEVTAIVSPFGQSTAIQLDQEGYIQSITNLQGESLQIGSTVGGLIIGTVNPRGRAAEYGFDTAGRLISQSDNSGYSQQFSRMTDASGYEVTRTTGLGRALSYTVSCRPQNG
jgi:YD repeat-containing protein